MIPSSIVVYVLEDNCYYVFGAIVMCFIIFCALEYKENIANRIERLKICERGFTISENEVCLTETAVGFNST